MRKLFLSMAAAVVLLASCNSSNSDKANTSAEQTVAAATGKSYVIADSSVIKWRATHKGGLNPRFGTIGVSIGSISADSGKVTGGSFTVNINSLTVDSASVTEADKKASQLEGHLKSPDFFNVAKYPTAKFEITKVEAFDSTKNKSTIAGATNVVSGNLTIKDSTVNVAFPAKISVTDNAINIVASFIVDRTSWGLNYGTQGSAADWMISKDFEIDINLNANAK
ncbi:MAG TPA: YceI family protein [Arachidicoccus sp.]